MRILVCDDDGLTVQRIARLLEQHAESKGYAADIIAVANPHQAALADEYDIVFLDVDMPQMSGIDLAGIIHQRWPNTVIVFMTNYVQYAPEGYEVGAFRYLMKSRIPDKLTGYFDLAVKERMKRLRIVTIQINGERIRIPVSNILYFESHGKIIAVHLTGNARHEYEFYGNMSDLEQKLGILGFLRVHKSYLVNMEHIEIFQCKRLELKNGTRIPSSERKYADLKQRYLKWEAENRWCMC